MTKGKGHGSKKVLSVLVSEGGDLLICVPIQAMVTQIKGLPEAAPDFAASKFNYGLGCA